jgi:hypothetical protein
VNSTAAGAEADVGTDDTAAVARAPCMLAA